MVQPSSRVTLTPVQLRRLRVYLLMGGWWQHLCKIRTPAFVFRAAYCSVWNAGLFRVYLTSSCFLWRLRSDDFRGKPSTVRSSICCFSAGIQREKSAGFHFCFLKSLNYFFCFIGPAICLLSGGVPAVEPLQKGFKDLHEVCQHVLNTFQVLVLLCLSDSGSFAARSQHASFFRELFMRKWE